MARKQGKTRQGLNTGAAQGLTEVDDIVINDNYVKAMESIDAMENDGADFLTEIIRRDGVIKTLDF